MKTTRSFGLQVFVLWLLALALIGLWRGWGLWQERSLLAEVGSKLSPPALVAFVGFSALCGMGLMGSAVGLWLQRRWGRLLALICIPPYFAIVQAYTWLFVQSGLMWARRSVSLILAVIAVGLGVGALTWRRSREWLGLREKGSDGQMPTDRRLGLPSTSSNSDGGHNS